MKRNRLFLLLICSSLLLALASLPAFADEAEQSAATQVQTSVSSQEEEGQATPEVAESQATLVEETQNPVEEPAPVSQNEYEVNVAAFNQVGIDEVYQMFQPDEKEHLLYVGRPTCYYCRQFSPTLQEFNQDYLTQPLDYYNTDSPDLDQKGADFLFKTVGIPGTPTLIRLANGQLLSAWVGGGVTADKLYASLYQDRPITAKGDPLVAEAEELVIPVEEPVSAPVSVVANLEQQVSLVSPGGGQVVADSTNATLSSKNEELASAVSEKSGVSLTSEQKSLRKLPETGQSGSLLSFLGALLLGLGMFIRLRRKA